MPFITSSLLLALVATTVSSEPQDEKEITFILGGHDEEYRDYCCDQFDRTDGHSTSHRLLGDCENAGAMAACFCGLLQDYEVTTRSSRASSSNLFLRSDSQAQDSSTGTPCVGGSAVGSADTYPCSNVSLMSFIPKSRFNEDQNANEDANDIWGWSHNDGGTVREFALIGLVDGVGMVEITDPANPIVLGRLGSPAGTSLWRDIKVYKDYAYVVSERSGHGLQIFNLTRLLTASTTSFTNFAADKTWLSFRAHNILINEDTGYAYLAGARNGNSYVCNGGMYSINFADPLNPETMGCATNTYTHDAHCVVYNGPDTAYFGKEICFLCNTDHVAIMDMSNKANPVIISTKTYQDSQYTHQGWLSSDHSYFVFGDELDETGKGVDTTILVMNVTDLKNPADPGRYVATGRRAIDHNLYIRSFGTTVKTDIIYLANYRAGMRILKVNDYADVGPSDSTDGFEEIAYFDTYPLNDDASYNGAWSVYPYFESGTVIISSIGEGLFVVRPDLSAFLPADTPSSEPSMSPSVTASSSPSMGPSSEPSLEPSMGPTVTASSEPSTSSAPSMAPTSYPSAPPSATPSAHPSWIPTSVPSTSPSKTPTRMPAENPTTSSEPTSQPSLSPSAQPTRSPSSKPSSQPSSNPSAQPTSIPSSSPTSVPSSSPSSNPSMSPTAQTSSSPSASTKPSWSPTSRPSDTPSLRPSHSPTSRPSSSPSSSPSSMPSSTPTATPNIQPVETTILNQWFSESLDGFAYGGNRVRYRSRDGRGSLELDVRNSDNPDTAPYIQTPTLDVSGYISLEINLSIYARGIDNVATEGLLVQYIDGSSWKDVKLLNRNDGTIAGNGVWYDDIILSVPVNGMSTTVFRFTNTANRRGEKINLDHVTIIGHSGGGVSSGGPPDTPAPAATPSPVEQQVTPVPVARWSVVSSNDFESGWGDFNDGGSDARRSSSDGQYLSSDGTTNYAVRIRDNSGRFSSVVTNELSVTGYSDIQVVFDFIAFSMENNEDFFVEVRFRGDSAWTAWTTVLNYASGQEFINGVIYRNVAQDFPVPAGGRSGMRIRFRCDASGNNDYVYIDNIVISGK
jgi:choice-of-anchor B domain-containing protein